MANRLNFVSPLAALLIFVAALMSACAQAPETKGRSSASEQANASGEEEVACASAAECAELWLKAKTKRESLQATKFFAQACEDRDASACNLIGLSYLIGRGVSKDPARSARAFQKACDLGHASACASLARFYRDGKIFPKDVARAVSIYEKACDKDVRGACHNLASMYLDGDGVKQDSARAASLYQKVCNLGFPGGCTSLAHLYARGDGVARDLKRAASLYEKACNGNWSEACGILGHQYNGGHGVPQDKARAASLYKKACDGNDAFGCNGYAWLRCHDQSVCDAEVEKAARKAVKLAPTNVHNLDTLAFVLCQRDQAKDGEAIYAKACELAPDSGGNYCAKHCEE